MNRNTFTRKIIKEQLEKFKEIDMKQISFGDNTYDNETELIITVFDNELGYSEFYIETGYEYYPLNEIGYLKIGNTNTEIYIPVREFLQNEYEIEGEFITEIRSEIDLLIKGAIEEYQEQKEINNG